MNELVRQLSKMLFEAYDKADDLQKRLNVAEMRLDEPRCFIGGCQRKVQTSQGLGHDIGYIGWCDHHEFLGKIAVKRLRDEPRGWE